jgi:RimJ/RimL family protein N-acetyltransferase
MPACPTPTARLRFRPVEANDFAAVHAYAGDPAVTRYTSFGPNSEEDTRGFLARAVAATAADPRTSWPYAIIHAASGTLIGSTGLELAEAVGPQLSFGYVLDPRWWGQGYATEAAGAILRFGFEGLGAHRLFAHVFVGNDASARVLTKLGLRLESEVKQGTFVRGQWHDVRTYGMLRREYERAESG